MPTYSNLRERLLTAGIAIAVVIALGVLAAMSCFGRVAAFMTAVMVVTACAWEFSVFATRTERQSRLTWQLVYFGVVSLPAIIAAIALLNTRMCVPELWPTTGPAVLTGVTVIGFLAANTALVVAGAASLEGARRVAQDLFPALLLVSFCGVTLMNLTLQHEAHYVVLWLLLVVCFNDAAAYFVGSQVKGPKLSPNISPNKTWSGAAGAYLVAVPLGVLTQGLVPRIDSNLDALCLSIAVVFAAQAGDLLKSYLKRIHSVKDTGSILPGHGGVLDRVDGILAGSAVLYLYIVFP